MKMDIGMKMALKRIYKNLFYDTERGMYFFIKGNEIRPLVEQQSYLLAYLIEIIRDKGGELNGW